MHSTSIVKVQRATFAIPAFLRITLSRANLR